MTPKERKARLKARVAEQRERGRAQVAALMATPRMRHPAALTALRKLQQEKIARRRRRLLALLALLLLLLLLSQCECQPAPTPAPARVDAGPKKVREVKVAPQKKRRRYRGKTKGTDRPDATIAPPKAPSWIEQLRIQVAARGPRLSTCFNDSEKPGALRWSTSVDAREGRVSQHRLAPVFDGAGLSDDQVECLTEILESPSYRLTPEEDDDQPRRVNLVFEF